MSELAAALGIPQQWTFKGRTYLVSQRDLEIEALLENRLEQLALEAIERGRSRMSEESHRRQLEIWQENCATSYWAWGGDASNRAIRSLPVAKYLLYLQLSKKQIDVKPTLLDEVAKDDAAWNALILAVRRVNGELKEPESDPTKGEAAPVANPAA
jgi:hypothetical protein